MLIRYALLVNLIYCFLLEMVSSDILCATPNGFCASCFSYLQDTCGTPFHSREESGICSVSKFEFIFFTSMKFIGCEDIIKGNGFVYFPRRNNFVYLFIDRRAFCLALTSFACGLVYTDLPRHRSSASG